jgi:cell division protein FtsB
VRGRAWLAVAVLALVGVLMLAVFPARTLVAQRHERSRLAARVKDLSAQNAHLDDQARLLQTDAEIERLARQHYNLVRPGEEAFAILPPPTTVPRPAAPRPAPVHRGDHQPLLRRAVGLVLDVF